MTLTADEKGRISCRELFPPHTTYDAIREADGRVILTRVKGKAEKPRLVKPVPQNGVLVLPTHGVEIDAEALDREIREERERENARLLG